MYKYRLSGLIALCIAAIISLHCSRPKFIIQDLIPLVHLKSGVADTLIIDDLYYAPTYDLQFEDHASIQVEWDAAHRKLILLPSEDFEGMTTLSFDYHGQMYSIPIIARNPPVYMFRYKPDRAVDKVNVFGMFNSWNRHDLPMTDEDGDGVYERTLILDPGRYEYRFFVDGREVVDPVNPQKVPNPFGEYNSLAVVKPRTPHSAFLHVMGNNQNGGRINLDFELETDDPEFQLTTNHVTALLNNECLVPSFTLIEGRRLTLSLPLEDLSGQVVVRVACSHRGITTGFQTVRLQEGTPANLRQESGDWQRAVIYSVMIDRFHDGDPENSDPIEHPELGEIANYYGGDLQGVIDKLDEGYFTDLGVNTLWLFPVLDNPDKAYREFKEPHRYYTGYHGYWPVHPTRIESRFGDLALFKTLVVKAHERGIRVLLDFVANHVHEDHPYYQQHPEWFGTLDLPDGRKNIHFWDEYRLTTWFDTFLPSFDFLGSPEALETMTDNAVWWLKETGIDGFRQDAVKHVPNTFWRTLTRKVKEKVELPSGRPIYQIGETFGGYDLVSSYVNNGQLNAQFNFQIYDVGQYVFLTPDASFRLLDMEMKKTFEVYGMHHLMGNLMDSHDKVRYMAQADGDVSLGDPLAEEKAWTDPPQVDHVSSYDKAKIYLAFVLTIPGVPVVYYGDEIGLTGAHDPDNRRPMRFGEDLSDVERQMRTDVSRWIALRRTHSALNYGDFLSLQADESIYAYVRSDMHERILVVLNKSERIHRVQLNMPEIYRLTHAKDLLTDETMVIAGDRIELKMPPLSASIFQLQ